MLVVGKQHSLWAQLVDTQKLCSAALWLQRSCSSTAASAQRVARPAVCCCVLLSLLQTSGLEELLAETAVPLQVVVEHVAPHLDPHVIQVCRAQA